MAEARDALQLAERIDPTRCRLKVGKELFTRAGPAVVEQLIGKGFNCVYGTITSGTCTRS